MRGSRYLTRSLKITLLSLCLMLGLLSGLTAKSIIMADTGLFVNRYSLYNANGHDKLDISSGGFQVTYYMGEKLFGAFVQATYLLPSEEAIRRVGSDSVETTVIDLGEAKSGIDMAFGPGLDFAMGPLHFLIGLGGHVNVMFSGLNYTYSMGIAATGYIYAPIVKFFSLNIGFNLAIDFFGDLSYSGFSHNFFRGYMAGFCAGIGFKF